MIKSAEYIQFEEGFIKQALEDGCDEQFLRGYIKEADELVDTWKAAFDELAEQSNDPHYRIKLANDIIMFTISTPRLMQKAAWDQSTVSNWLGQQSQNLGMGNGVSTFLNDPKNKNFLSNFGTGAGGGGLIGLLIGLITGHPMSGMMLGGLGGAGIGAAFNQGWLKDMFNKPPVQPAQPQPGATPPATPVAKPGVAPAPTNAAVPTSGVNPTPSPAPGLAPKPGMTPPHPFTPPVSARLGMSGAGA